MIFLVWHFFFIFSLCKPANCAGGYVAMVVAMNDWWQVTAVFLSVSIHFCQFLFVLVSVTLSAYVERFSFSCRLNFNFGEVNFTFHIFFYSLLISAKSATVFWKQLGNLVTCNAYIIALWDLRISLLPWYLGDLDMNSFHLPVTETRADKICYIIPDTRRTTVELR